MHRSTQLLGLAGWLAVAAPLQAAPAPTLSVKVTDIDTNEGLAGMQVTWSRESGEIWAVDVGKTDESGQLHVPIESIKGATEIWLGGDGLPKEYAFAGFRDYTIPHNTLGKSYEVHFWVRHIDRSPHKLPQMVTVTPELSAKIASPEPDKGNYYLSAAVGDMPGFENQTILLRFSPEKLGAEPGQLKPKEAAIRNAEVLYANGKRLAILLEEAVDYFNRAAPEHQLDASLARMIRISVGPKVSVMKVGLPSQSCGETIVYRLYLFKGSDGSVIGGGFDRRGRAKPLL